MFRRIYATVVALIVAFGLAGFVQTAAISRKESFLSLVATFILVVGLAAVIGIWRDRDDAHPIH